MKKNLILLLFMFSFLVVSTTYGAGTRSVYFFDRQTGETTLLTSQWLKQDVIDVKDSWFSKFEENTVSGIIFIEDSREYAVIPYVHHSNFGSLSIQEFYQDHVDSTYELTWMKKTSNASLSFEVISEQPLWASVEITQSIPGTTTKYGRGIYTMPVFDGFGNRISELSFAENDYMSLNESWNDFIPRFVLQQFIFIEIELSTHHPMTIFMPVYFLGGSNLMEVGDQEHYLYPYRGHDLVFEAEILRLRPPYCGFDCIHENVTTGI